jgi:hypothetical protein
MSQKLQEKNYSKFEKGWRWISRRKKEKEEKGEKEGSRGGTRCRTEWKKEEEKVVKMEET